MCSSTKERYCPVCRSETKIKLFLKKKINKEKINSFSFSSRKNPEFMRHQLVKCLNCSLVYSNFPPTQSSLKDSYHQADFDSKIEAKDASDTYINAIKSEIAFKKYKNRALDIGTGDGIFLEGLKKIGFLKPEGIEPSINAIKSAPKERQLIIKNGIFKEEDYASESFDLITCFMTLEHVLDPFEVSKSAFNLLRKGGVFITVTHNYESKVNRILHTKSPIIDIEHMQLFSDKSIRKLMTNVGFEKVVNKAFKNRYRISYWIRLLPVPNNFKKVANKILFLFKLDEMRLSLCVGNQITTAYKK